MLDPEPDHPRRDNALKRSESCRHRCFAVPCQSLSELNDSFRIESKISEVAQLTPKVRDCVRSVIVRGQVRFREALRGEICCSADQVAICFGKGLFEVLAPQVLERASQRRAFRGQLRKVKDAIADQVREICVQAHDEVIARPKAKAVRQALSERSGQWLLEYWRRFDAVSTSASRWQHDNRNTSQQPCTQNLEEHADSGRSVTSLIAAKRTRDFIARQGLRRSEFAVRAQIAERTLRRFLDRETATHSVVEQIAQAMGITKAELLAEADTST
jgi:hypothetical protein